jgi:superoxide reductase
MVWKEANMPLGDWIQTADWKAEKHAPVVDCPDEVVVDTPFTINVSVGKEIAHPNTTEHHVSWIDVFFKPDGVKFAHHVGRFEFKAHGESVKGANQGPAYTHPNVTFSMQVNGAGTLTALALCNIHGLWESSKTIQVSL